MHLTYQCHMPNSILPVEYYRICNTSTVLGVREYYVIMFLINSILPVENYYYRNTITVLGVLEYCSTKF
jgi:hypothetical protein